MTVRIIESLSTSSSACTQYANEKLICTHRRKVAHNAIDWIWVNMRAFSIVRQEREYMYTQLSRHTLAYTEFSDIRDRSWRLWCTCVCDKVTFVVLILFRIPCSMNNYRAFNFRVAETARMVFLMMKEFKKKTRLCFINILDRRTAPLPSILNKREQTVLRRWQLAKRG